MKDLFLFKKKKKQKKFKREQNWENIGQNKLMTLCNNKIQNKVIMCKNSISNYRCLFKIK